MGDPYAQVEVRLEQMKSLGEDAEREGVHSEEPAPASSPGASDPPSVGVACGNVSRGSVRGHRSRGGKMGKDKNTCGSSDPSIYGSLASVLAKKNANRAEPERTLQVKGNGKALQGKLGTNGNHVNNRASENNHDAARREEALKLARRRRPVTVDTAKAKTSLEALKLSIKQLKWKEVRGALGGAAEVLLAHVPCKFCSRRQGLAPASVHSWCGESHLEKGEKANPQRKTFMCVSRV